MEIQVYGATQLRQSACSRMGPYASQSGGEADEPEESKTDKDVPPDEGGEE